MIWSTILVVLGLAFALWVDSGDVKVFGWLLVAVGVLGFVSRAWLAGREPPRSMR